MKNKLILSGLFLTSAISCSNFRPVVLLNAFLNPESEADVTYEDINFQNALFNQFASGLSYTIRLNYSSAAAGSDHRAFGVYVGTYEWFRDWTTITNTFSEGACVGACKSAMNQVLFNRDFDRTTKKAVSEPNIQLTKFGNNVGPNDTINLEIKIRSAITYNVNVGSIFLSDKTFINGSIDGFYSWITFYRGNQVANTFLLNPDASNTKRDRLFNTSTILTGIDGFDLWYQWEDFPPFANNASVTQIYEFNLFTQGSQISIPDNAESDRFGFKFVAVEWWNILGHLQNFAWWIVNESPVAPVFEWIDEYVITWVSGLITFITGVFRL